MLTRRRNGIYFALASGNTGQDFHSLPNAASLARSRVDGYEGLVEPADHLRRSGSWKPEILHQRQEVISPTALSWHRPTTAGLDGRQPPARITKQPRPLSSNINHRPALRSTSSLSLARQSSRRHLNSCLQLECLGSLRVAIELHNLSANGRSTGFRQVMGRGTTCLAMCFWNVDRSNGA